MMTMMEKLLICTFLLGIASSAFLRKENNNYLNKLNQFERYLSSQLTHSRECLKQLMCMTWKDQTAQDNILPYEMMKAPLDEMAREYESTSIESKKNLGLIKGIYDEHMLLKMSPNSFEDCYEAFPDCPVMEQDLEWFLLLRVHQNVTADMLDTNSAEYRKMLETVVTLIEDGSQSKTAARKTEIHDKRLVHRPKRQLACANLCLTITSAICSASNLACSLTAAFIDQTAYALCNLIATSVCSISLICPITVNTRTLSRANVDTTKSKCL